MKSLKTKPSKTNPLRPLQNESGVALLYVLVFSLIIVSIFTSVMLQNQNSEKQLYQARFRNQLDAFETRWQTLLGQPSTYINCKFDVPGSCQLNTDVVKKYKKLSLIGGGCIKPQTDGNQGSRQTALSDGTPLPTCDLTCGFCASVTLTDSVAKLVINPVGTSLRALNANIQIPYDVLQVQTISCPAIDNSKPRFAGIDAKGNAICKPLVSPKCQFPGIQYATGIDARTGAIICKNIPNLKIDCPDDSFMSVFGWSKVAIGHSCAVRKWPYVFNYPADPIVRQPTQVAAATPAPTQPNATPEPEGTPCYTHWTDPNGVNYMNGEQPGQGIPGCNQYGVVQAGQYFYCPGWTYNLCPTPIPTTTPCPQTCTFTQGQGSSCTSSCSSSRGSAPNSNPGGINGSGIGGNGGAGGGL